MTAMGIIGIKVWINKGEIMEHDPSAREKRMNAQGNDRGGRSNDRGGRGGDNRRDRRPARTN